MNVSKMRSAFKINVSILDFTDFPQIVSELKMKPLAFMIWAKSNAVVHIMSHFKDLSISPSIYINVCQPTLYWLALQSYQMLGTLMSCSLSLAAMLKLTTAPSLEI